jgi:hypothetical protein
MNISLYIRQQRNIENFSSVHTFCNFPNRRTPAELKKFFRKSGLHLAIVLWYEKPHFEFLTPFISQIAQMSSPSLADEGLLSSLVWILLKAPGRINA